MHATRLEPSAASAPPRDPFTMRLAGIAGLVAGLGFLPQPLLVFALPAPDGAEFWPPERMPELSTRITVQALAWGLFAAALLVLVIALGRMTGGALGSIGTAFGVIGAASWLAEAAWRLIPLSMPAQHLTEAPVGAATQGSILFFLDLADYGWTALGAIGLGAWRLTLIGARDALPRWLRVLAAIVGAVDVVTVFLLPSLPFGLALMFPLFAVIGVVLLRRSRETVAPSELPSAGGARGGA